MGNGNRGLGLLYLLLGIGVVVAIIFAVGIDEFVPVSQTINWGSLFGAELAPNHFVTCTARGFTFYVDDVNNRRQGDFDFDKGGLFTEFSLVSRTTGVTIETFEQELRLQCDSSLNLPMKVTSGSTIFTSGGTRSQFVVDVIATDINGNEKLIDTLVMSIGEQNLPDNQEIVLGKVVISADDIEDVIAPTTRATRAGAGGVDPSIQQFDSQLRFDTGYELFFDIDGVTWKTFGGLDNGYRVTWINDEFTAGGTQPTSTDIKLDLQTPSNGLLNDNKQIILSATLPFWQQGEGNPAFKVTSEQTGATVASTIMSLSSQNDERAIFTENVLLRTTETGKFKVTISSTGRVPATALLSTTDPIESGGENGDGTTKSCVVPIGFVDSALIASLQFLTGSCLEDVQKQCSQGLVAVANTCIPAGIAGLLQGINLIILFVVIIVIAIVIKVGISIARKPKQTAQAFVPTGL